MGINLVDEAQAQLRAVSSTCESILRPFRIGYTQGTFDMFHVGHLNLIEGAARLCDVLYVGVNSDELVEAYKGKRTVVCEENRCRIVAALGCVASACIVSTLDKAVIHKSIPFEAVFIGDDWKGDERWIKTEQDLIPLGAQVVYLPHTSGVSSTGLRGKVSSRVRE